jgi:hypothetical protein
LIDQIDVDRIVARDNGRGERERDENNHDAGAKPGAPIPS